MAQLTLSKVIKRFGDVQTIHGVDLQIRHGEFVVFVGPSGCGKSTLLRLIAGLEEISDGEIGIDGQCVNDVSPSERGIGMVFQSYALYPHMTVAQNMGFGLKIAGVDKQEIAARVLDAAKILKLDRLLERTPKQLSGGQRQRVAIGRAIVRQPKVFLFDEPLSNLDAELRVQMRVEIAKLHEQIGNTMIYVTHDQVEAMTMADKIVVLRDGRIEQVGSPLELYHAPVNQFVAGFIGSPKMNFIPVTAESVQGQRVVVSLPDGQQLTLPVTGPMVRAGETLTLGIRPEHIGDTAEAGEVAIEVAVDVVERLGGSTYAYAGYGPVEGFTICAPGNSQLMRNSLQRCYFKLADCHLFDSQGRAVMPRQQPSQQAA